MKIQRKFKKEEEMILDKMDKYLLPLRGVGAQVALDEHGEVVIDYFPCCGEQPTKKRTPVFSGERIGSRKAAVSLRDGVPGRHSWQVPGNRQPRKRIIALLRKRRGAQY